MDNYLFLVIAIAVLVIANGLGFAYAWYAHKRIDSIIKQGRYLVMEPLPNLKPSKGAVKNPVFYKVDKDDNSVTISTAPDFLKDKIDGD